MIWKQWTKLLMALSVWACAACDMVEYHPYDLDIDGETEVNRKQMARIEAATAGNVRFVCLNTNALEFDYTQAVPDFDFLDRELRSLPAGVEKTVVAMHAGPYSEQFNNNVAAIFHRYICQFPGLQFCIYGHGHSVAENEFFEDGISYYECACAKKRSYLYFTISEEGYRYEAVDY